MIRGLERMVLVQTLERHPFEPVVYVACCLHILYTDNILQVLFLLTNCVYTLGGLK
jgi:hypothetical protein